jgi:hypothetical protein
MLIIICMVVGVRGCMPWANEKGGHETAFSVGAVMIYLPEPAGINFVPSLNVTGSQFGHPSGASAGKSPGVGQAGS